MIQSDIIIIGAGPVGLFTVFEAGLMKLRCHLIDTIPSVGGQLSEIYPRKPIYDIPGFPIVLAGDLINNLMEQIAPFKPGFTLGERAETIEKQKDNSFVITTNEGTSHKAPVIIIAGGLGSFEPRKPKIDSLTQFEKKGVEYLIREPKEYLNQKIFVSGGGDSALDWVIYFAENHDIPVGLVHRTNMFRAHNDSVEKIYELRDANKVQLFTNAEIVDLKGKHKLEQIVLKEKEKPPFEVNVNYWFPLFGLSPKLGPIANWGLEVEKNAIKVDHTLDYQTNIPGIFAVGDINTYPGKLKLILCGFHEATLAVQTAYKIVHPNKRFVMKYTTVRGIEKF